MICYNVMDVFFVVFSGITKKNLVRKCKNARTLYYWPKIICKNSDF